MSSNRDKELGTHLMITHALLHHGRRRTTALVWGSSGPQSEKHLCFLSQQSLGAGESNQSVPRKAE